MSHFTYIKKFVSNSNMLTFWLLNVIKFNIRSHIVTFDCEKLNMTCTSERFIYSECLVDQLSSVSGKGVCFIFFPYTVEGNYILLSFCRTLVFCYKFLCETMKLKVLWLNCSSRLCFRGFWKRIKVVFVFLCYHTT